MIHYPDGMSGTLIYLKPGLTEKTPADVLNYALQNKNPARKRGRPIVAMKPSSKAIANLATAWACACWHATSDNQRAQRPEPSRNPRRCRPRQGIARRNESRGAFRPQRRIDVIHGNHRSRRLA